MNTLRQLIARYVGWAPQIDAATDTPSGTYSGHG
jgi:hypothetical protein